MRATLAVVMRGEADAGLSTPPMRPRPTRCAWPGSAGEVAYADPLSAGPPAAYGWFAGGVALSTTFWIAKRLEYHFRKAGFQIVELTTDEHRR